jgi:hypothetical protein
MGKSKFLFYNSIVNVRTASQDILWTYQSSELFTNKNIIFLLIFGFFVYIPINKIELNYLSSKLKYSSASDLIIELLYFARQVQARSFEFLNVTVGIVYCKQYSFIKKIAVTKL